GRPRAGRASARVLVRRKTQQKKRNETQRSHRRGGSLDQGGPPGGRGGARGALPPWPPELPGDRPAPERPVRAVPAEPHPPPPRGSPRVIAIGGGPGGAGKSLLTVNLGVYLAQLGRNVIIADVDPAGGGLHTMLGLDPTPPPKPADDGGDPPPKPKSTDEG